MKSSALDTFLEYPSLCTLITKNWLYFVYRNSITVFVYFSCGWPPKVRNRIGGLMVLSSSVVDRGFEPLSGQTKDYKIGICCFSATHAALGTKSKALLARNQDNVSEWGDMSIHGLLFQWASTIKKNQINRVGLVQCGPHHHFIEN